MKHRLFAAFILALLIFVFPSLKSQAQWGILRADADSLVLLGSNHIYNLEFEQANKCFQDVISLYPNHPAGYFLEAMVDWWKIWIFKEKEIYDNSFLQKIQKVIDVCDIMLDSNSHDINALFFKGGALGYRGRYYAIRESWLNAASDAKEAFDILQLSRKIAPGNHDIMLGTGIYNYFAVKFPEEYPLLRPFMVFLPKGDLTIGLLELQAASRYARYASTEAKVVLLQVFYQYEKNYQKTFDIAFDLYMRYPNNPYFHKYLARTYVSMGQTQQMEFAWRDILKNYIAKKPGYDAITAREALYYIGYALMLRGDYQKSLEYFYKCDEACRKIDKEPSGFMVKLNLKIGQIYDMQKKRDLAIKQYKKVLKMKEYQDSHQTAELYISRPYGQ